MKRMLINATQSEERRLAIVDGQKLMDFETEIEGREQRKGNIYKAVVTRVEPSLEACFVDYGEDRHGFLPFKEISKNYFREGTDARTARIQDAIRDGDSLLVQVEKEERGNKGAALTTFVSLAGRYLVLMPNNPRGGGVSRRIEGEDREELKENLDQLEYPKGMSLIARTAGIGRTAPELQWDLNYMLKLWAAIDGASKAGKGAFLIYQESSLVIRAIRDYFTADVGEILIDTDDIFDQAQQFMEHVMPETAHKVKRYRDDAALFSRFQIEHQIETAFSRTVNLPSGGAIVIDHTEALVSVDVNSARSTRGSDIEETATRTNLEAADEIARQMRLRDLGGLIVVDFIDMEESKNRREVETRLRDALRQDRARVQFSSISKFGLLELSRQRLRPALSEGSHITCPRCNGTGHIRDTESSALQILRMVQEESMKENTAAVHVQVPVEVVSFLLNEKRTEITKIELKQRVTVLLVPNKNLDTPNYRLERLRHDDPRLENLQASYTMVDESEDETAITRREKAKPKQEPVIKGIMPETPAPVAIPKAEPVAIAAPVMPAPAPVIAPAPAMPAGGGFFSWVKGLFGGNEMAPAPLTVTPDVPSTVASIAPGVGEPRRDRGDRSDRGGRGGRGGRGRSGERGESAERGEGRGKRGEGRAASGEGARADAPTGARNDERAPRTERQARPDTREPREAREPREPRAEGEGRGEGRRGRGDREGRARAAAPEAMPEGTPTLNAEGVAPELFVDTMPGFNASEAGVDANGERQGGRRRNRRGGRGGRDRDDARGATPNDAANGNVVGDANLDAPADGPAPSMAPTPGASAFVGESVDGSPATLDAPREEGTEAVGRRRGRGRGGRDRGPRLNEGATAEDGATIGAHANGNATVDGAGFAPEPSGMNGGPALEDAAASMGSIASMHETSRVDAPMHEAPAVARPDTTRSTQDLAPATLATSNGSAVEAGHPFEVPATASVLPVAPFELPIDSLEAVATNAGLQWVNSDADKIRAVQAAMAAEPRPVHVPRERQPAPSVDAGPLVLVETRKDLSNVKLPFESASHGDAGAA